VVAEEISKLADSTGQSAGEITQLVESIREESRKIQTTMQDNIREMDAGRTAIDRAGTAFAEIIRNAQTTQTKASSIAELSEKQTEGATSMVSAIEEISRVVSDNAAATQQVSATTQEQSASMEEMAHSAQALSALAEELLNLVRRFQLGVEKG
jgi:methyl-accepting chemotaxis protein